jgi:hypothetical protein
VDNGASNLYVPSTVLKELLKSINKLGADISTPSTVVSNCEVILVRGPSLRISIGEFSIDLSPLDYLEPAGADYCWLKANDQKISGDTLILGNRVMQKAAFFLDNVNTSLGLCSWQV